MWERRVSPSSPLFHALINTLLKDLLLWVGRKGENDGEKEKISFKISPHPLGKCALAQQFWSQLAPNKIANKNTKNQINLSLFSGKNQSTKCFFKLLLHETVLPREWERVADSVSAPLSLPHTLTLHFSPLRRSDFPRDAAPPPPQHLFYTHPTYLYVAKNH